MKATAPITIPPIVLKKGGTYFIADFYGMIGFEASYVGLAEGGDYDDDEVMLFERVDLKGGSYRYAGVIPECAAVQTFGKDKRDVIGVTLTAHYYGMTIDTLEHVKVRGREKKPWRVIT